MILRKVFLEDKITAGDGIIKTINNEGGNENVNLEIGPHYLSLASTGINTGGGLSIGVTTGTFDITEGEGFFIDANADFNNIELNSVTIAARTNIAITNILTNPVSYISVDKNDNIIQSTTFPTAIERRAAIFLGVVVHSDNVTVNATNNLPIIANNPMSQMYDRWMSQGDYFNIKGNLFSFNGNNLNINKSIGDVFKTSINYDTDKNNPHIKTFSADNALTFRYRLQNSNEDADTIVIDPNNYDVGGIKTTVPSNKYTIQRIDIFPSGLVRIQYGQNLYDSLEDAEANVALEPFVIEPNINENGLLRCHLIIEEGSTDLSDPLRVKFIEASRSGVAKETNVGGAIFRTQLLNDASTGVREGGVLSVNGGNPSLLDITSGTGRVIDNTTDSNNPTLKEVRWSSFTAEALPNIATNVITYIAIDENDTLIKQSSDFTPQEYRELVVLGRVGHIDNVNITSITNLSVPFVDPLLTTVDLSNAVGNINTSGNIFTAQGGNLILNKSVGTQFRLGSNKHIDGKNPHSSTQASLTSVTFVPVYRDGSGGVNIEAPTTLIDPDQWDDGSGILQTVPNNKFTAQRIVHFSSNVVVIAYGQTIYNNIEEAIAGVSADPFETPGGVTGGITRASIVIKKGTSDLSNSTTTKIIQGSKFGEFTGGGGGGGTTSNLQTIYNNSTPNPEIQTNATNGSFTLRVGSGSDLDNVFESQNTAGTPTFQINGDGDVIISGDLTIQGDSTTVNSEITTSDAVLDMNFGETGPGVTLGYSGLNIERGTVNNFWFGFDEVRDKFTVGTITALNQVQIATTQVLATRADSLTDQSIVKWDNSLNQFIDSGKLISDLDNVAYTNINNNFSITQTFGGIVTLGSGANGGTLNWSGTDFWVRSKTGKGLILGANESQHYTIDVNGHNTWVGNGQFGGTVKIDTTSGLPFHSKTNQANAQFRIETTHPSGIPNLELKGLSSATIRYIDETDTIQARIDLSDSGFNFFDGASSIYSIVNGHNTWTGGGQFGGSLLVNSGITNTALTLISTDTGTTLRLQDSIGNGGLEYNSNTLYIDSDKDETVANSQIKMRVDGSTKFTLDSNGVIFGGILYTKGGFSEPNIETGYQIKFSDNGGTHNDVGIGLAGTLGSEQIWYNTTPTGKHRFMFGTAGEKMSINSTGLTVVDGATFGGQTNYTKPAVLNTDVVMSQWGDSTNGIQMVQHWHAGGIDWKLKKGNGIEFVTFNQNGSTYFGGNISIASTKEIRFLGNGLLTTSNNVFDIHADDNANGIGQIRLRTSGGDSAHFLSTGINFYKELTSTLGATFGGQTIHNGGIQLNGQSLRFDESGIRSWLIQVSGGNLLYNSGDGLGKSIFNHEVQADKFIGDGSQLTNIASGALPSNVAYTNVNNNFSVDQVFQAAISTKSGFAVLNKAETGYITWATRNTTGSEAVYDLTNMGSATFKGIIKSESTSPQVRVNTSSGTGTGYYIFGDVLDDDVAWISYQHSDNSMRFRVNANEKMSINSTGLTVVDGATFGGNTDINGRLSINKDLALSSSRIDFYDNNTAMAYLGYGTQANGSLSWVRDGSELFRSSTSVFNINTALNVGGVATLANALSFETGNTDFQIYNVGTNLWIRDNTNTQDLFRFSNTGVQSYKDLTAPNFIGNWNGNTEAQFDAKYDSSNFIAGIDYNPTIGTNTDILPTGTEIISSIILTNGVVTGSSKFNLTLAHLGYTGDTNANYITNNNQLINGAGYTSNIGTITSIATGTGLDGGTVTSGGITISLDLNELGNGGTLLGTDYLVSVNGTVSQKQLISSIPLSVFNNDAGFITSVSSDYVKKNEITDYTKQHYFTPQTLTYGANITWDLDNKQKAKVLLTGNATIDNPGSGDIKPGATYTLIVEQDITGGRTLTWGSYFDFGNDGTPTLSISGNEYDILVFEGSHYTNVLCFIGIKKGFTSAV